MTEALDEEMGLDTCVDPSELDDEVPEVTGSEAAFERYINRARALAKGEVMGYRGNASLGFHNVERGVKAVMEKREIVEKLPGIDVERLYELPDLALAVVYAAALAARAAGELPAEEYKRLLSRGHAVRRPLLLSLEACAEIGLVPAGEVKPIRSGRGPLDLAGDLVTLAALFRKHSTVLKNKTPITASLLEEANEIGTSLQMLLKPKGTPVVKTPRTPEQTESDRNRLFTLLVRGHAELRRVAAFLFGDEVANHVPALQSRLRIAPKPPLPAA